MLKRFPFNQDICHLRSLRTFEAYITNSTDQDETVPQKQSNIDT